MTYRNTEYLEYCTDCEETCFSHCARCNRPFCETHVPMEDKRCVTCEGQYDKNLQDKGFFIKKENFWMKIGVSMSVRSLIYSMFIIGGGYIIGFLGLNSVAGVVLIVGFFVLLFSLMSWAITAAGLIFHVFLAQPASLIEKQSKIFLERKKILNETASKRLKLS